MAGIRQRSNKGQFIRRDDSRMDMLVSRVKLAEDLGIKFGSMGPDGSEAPRHPKAKGLNAAQLLAIHELGLGVPERSVIRWVALNRKREIDRASRTAMRHYVAGRWTADRAREYVGDIVVELLRRRLMSRIPPPLAESTRSDPDRDPRGIPLVDTETILGSLRWAKQGRR